MVKSDDRKSRKLSPVVVAAELRAVHAGVGRAVGRKIGQLARVSFSGWNQVKRYDPEGLRSPGGERRLENREGVLISDLATGDVR